jgi:phytoene synthase
VNTVSTLDTTLVNRASPPGSMRYFATLYTPEERREAVTALFVIDTEIRESAQSVNHDVAHTRLRWWRAEVDRLVNGEPQHPAARVLHATYAGDRGSFAKLHESLVAADMDLARMTYANTKELRAYCSRSAGAIMELIATSLTAEQPLDEATRAAATRMGIGIRLAEILRDLHQDAHAGRIYLPLDRLEQHGIRPEDLNRREMNKNLRAALKAFRESAQSDLHFSLGSAQRETLRPIAILAALHRRLLDRIAARNYDVASERIDLGPIEKPWVAWREARKTK